MHHLECAQIVFVDQRMLGECKNNRRNNERERNLVVLDDAAKWLQFESLHDIDSDASINRLE